MSRILFFPDLILGFWVRFGPFRLISWPDSASGRQNTPIGGLKTEFRRDFTKIDNSGALPKKVYYYVLDPMKKIFSSDARVISLFVWSHGSPRVQKHRV